MNNKPVHILIGFGLGFFLCLIFLWNPTNNSLDRCIHGSASEVTWIKENILNASQLESLQNFEDQAQ